MGQGMAVCSLGGTHIVLHCGMVPAVPRWGPDLVGGASLGNGTLLPSGRGAENLRGSSWSLTTVTSLVPLRSGLCHQDTETFSFL